MHVSRQLFSYALAAGEQRAARLRLVHDEVHGLATAAEKVNVGQRHAAVVQQPQKLLSHHCHPVYNVHDVFMARDVHNRHDVCMVGDRAVLEDIERNRKGCIRYKYKQDKLLAIISNRSGSMNAICTSLFQCSTYTYKHAQAAIQTYTRGARQTQHCQL